MRFGLGSCRCARWRDGSGMRRSARLVGGAGCRRRLHKSVSADGAPVVVSGFVDIRLLDATALADDAVMRDIYDVSRRAELYGRPDAPFWEFPEFLGGFRSPDSGERQELFAAYDGSRMVGMAVLWSFLLDNTEKAAF